MAWTGSNGHALHGGHGEPANWQVFVISQQSRHAIARSPGMQLRRVAFAPVGLEILVGEIPIGTPASLRITAVTIKVLKIVPAVRSRCNGDQARPGGRMSMCHVSRFEAYVFSGSQRRRL